jgi:pimeloyl-ACP methyl ester carboxylesterase
VPRRLATTVALALVLAACGGTASSVSVGSTAAPLTTTTDVPSTAPPATDPETTAPGTTETSSPPATQPDRVPAIDWRSCKSGLQCATYAVPLDYSDPSKGSIDLYVKRRPASKPSERVGSLFVNPGGPGVPGTELVDQAKLQFSTDLLDHFDIISWDPRGTGRSSQVDCVDNLDPYFGDLDPTPDDDAEKQALLDSAKQWAAACMAKEATLLPHISTQDAARDMDQLRQALREDKTSYFGFSYGSDLGAVYATMFPEHVRAMVLDGASNPNADYKQDALDAVKGMEASLDAALADCAGNESCRFYNGGQPEKAFDELAVALDQHPIVVSRDRPAVGHGVFYYAIISALYDESFWPVLMDALADAQNGNAKALLGMYDDYLQRNSDGTWSNEFEALVAINCLDDPGPQGDPSVVDGLAAELEAVAPRLGAWAAYGDLCMYWPVPAVPKLRVTGAGAGPIVVVGTTGDPITPLESSRQLAEDELEDGHLVTVVAQRHTGYGVNQCSVNAVDGYLIDLVVPDEGLVCR